MDCLPVVLLCCCGEAGASAVATHGSGLLPPAELLPANGSSDGICGLNSTCGARRADNQSSPDAASAPHPPPMLAVVLAAPLSNATEVPAASAPEEHRLLRSRWAYKAWQHLMGDLAASPVYLATRDGLTEGVASSEFFKTSMAPILAATAAWLLLVAGVQLAKWKLGEPLPSKATDCWGWLCLPCLKHREEPASMSIMPQWLYACLFPCCCKRAPDEHEGDSPAPARSSAIEAAAEEEKERRAFRWTAAHFTLSLIHI